MSNKQTYGLFTTISMIVGIVIGSGIYFRADDILNYTNGDLILGMVVLSLGACCIIFGSLTISKLASIKINSGGVVGYFEEYTSKKIAAGFGWFQLFMYYPAISVVVSWVGVIYICILFNIELNFLTQVVISSLISICFIFLNYFSRKIGGYFQNITLVIKMIPLLLIALFGIIFGKSYHNTNSFIQNFELNKLNWLSALVPIAYSYDGWVIGLSISKEVKNYRKNVSRALILSPIIILFTYLLYFYGITNILGSEHILAAKDSSVIDAANKLFGHYIGNFVNVIIVISILGVLNGINLAGIRMPQALAEKGFIPDFGISKINEKYQLSLKSTFLFVLLIIIWSITHYITLNYNVFNGRDVSEITIVFGYCTYVILYLKVIKLIKNNQIKKTLSGYLIPALAIVGSMIILIGSLITQFVYVLLFLTISSFIFLLGIKYYEIKHKNLKENIVS